MPDTHDSKNRSAEARPGLEEIEPDSLSSKTVGTADTDELIEKAERYRDQPVWDVNGERVGKIEKSFAEDGEFALLQATLDEGFRQRHEINQDIGSFPEDLIADVEDDGIHLRVGGEHFLSPADPGAPERGGSSTFPRKER